MKGEKFTADNPTPKPGKRTTAMGTPIPDDFFENESDEAAVLKSVVRFSGSWTPLRRGFSSASRVFCVESRA